MIPSRASGSSATLVLFTESYPFGGIGEDVFITPEINCLAEEFERVIIVPVLDFGERESLPENVTVEDSFLKRPGYTDKIKSLFRSATYTALTNDLSRIKSFSDLRSELAFSAYALYYREKVESLVSKYGLERENTLFYTFWFDFATVAVALTDEYFKLITRAHGQDLYEETKPFISRYWRKKTFKKLLGCFTVSEYSAEYLKKLYPESADKISCRYLGTMPPESLNPNQKEERTVSLLSCSRVSNEKRTVYQCKIINEYARRHPELKVKWLHIGDGPEMTRLKKETEKAPDNLEIELTGTLKNREIRNILSHNHFDLALLLSSTEGLGLVICEAESFGIPVLGTDVQAIPEAVGEPGFIMPMTDDVLTCANMLEKALSEAGPRREAARSHWEKHFNAEILRRDFVREIRKLLD